MNITKKRITDRIHLFLFDTEKDAASAFLRFEESYESPEFRHKVFTFEEFKKWYMKNSPKNKGRRIFTYYSDWTAFNVPSYIFKPFYEGKFNPLSPSEKRILKMLRGEIEPYYVIALHRQTENMRSDLHHEVAHGLFHVDDQYRREVLQLLGTYDIGPIKEKLRSSGGYHEETLDDEIQARIIDGDAEYRDLIPAGLAESLQKLFQNYSKRNNTNLAVID